MNKLTKDHNAQLEDLRTRWRSVRADMESAIVEANEAITEKVAAINVHVADLNAIIEEANQLREQIAADIQSHIEDKSEKWQESDRGSAFSEWQSSWDSDVSEVTEIEAEEIQAPDDAPEVLMSEDEYPSEPSA